MRDSITGTRICVVLAFILCLLSAFGINFGQVDIFKLGVAIFALAFVF